MRGCSARSWPSFILGPRVSTLRPVGWRRRPRLIYRERDAHVERRKRKAPRCRRRPFTSACASPAPPRATCSSAPRHRNGGSGAPNVGPRMASSSTGAARNCHMASSPPPLPDCRSRLRRNSRTVGNFVSSGNRFPAWTRRPSATGARCLASMSSCLACSTPPSKRRLRSAARSLRSGTKPMSSRCLACAPS